MPDAGNGPLGGATNRPAIDTGTLALTDTSSPAANACYAWDGVDAAIDMLHAELANAGATGAIDGAARARYDTLIRQYRAEIRGRVRSGRLTWTQAAEEAVALRNTVMEVVRGRSTPVGRAWATAIKSRGRTLNELVARKTIQLFGDGVEFNALTVAQRNRVFSEIVIAAGKSEPGITATMRTVSRAGRGLLVLSIGISVYTVATSDDPGEAARHEGAVTLAGIGGGAAGGALAGLACGPGAPVCVTVGAFVGGALAAFGVDMLW